jgi:hypothetical protein
MFREKSRIFLVLNPRLGQEDYWDDDPFFVSSTSTLNMTTVTTDESSSEFVSRSKSSVRGSRTDGQLENMRRTDAAGTVVGIHA